MMVTCPVPVGMNSNHLPSPVPLKKWDHCIFLNMHSFCLPICHQWITFFIISVLLTEMSPFLFSCCRRVDSHPRRKQGDWPSLFTNSTCPFWLQVILPAVLLMFLTSLIHSSLNFFHPSNIFSYANQSSVLKVGELIMLLKTKQNVTAGGIKGLIYPFFLVNPSQLLILFPILTEFPFHRNILSDLVSIMEFHFRYLRILSLKVDLLSLILYWSDFPLPNIWSSLGEIDSTKPAALLRIAAQQDSELKNWDTHSTC